MHHRGYVPVRCLPQNSHENPELVWDDAARRKVQKVVSKMTKIFLQEQLANPNARFVLPEDFEVRAPIAIVAHRRCMC